MPRTLHKWSPPHRPSTEVTIRICMSCELAWHSNHDWHRGSKGEHWSEYFQKDAPDVRMTVLPVCERAREDSEAI